jgi:branched-subunit amino acid transport protein
LTFPTIIALAIGTYAIRASGIFLRGKISVSCKTNEYLKASALSMLGSFAVFSIVHHDSGFDLAKVLGAAVGIALGLLKFPFFLSIISAMLLTAALRL